MSTTKVEYIAIVEVYMEALWLAQNLGAPFEMPMLHVDSQSAIMLSKNTMFNSKGKVRTPFLNQFPLFCLGFGCTKQTRTFGETSTLSQQSYGENRELKQRLATLESQMDEMMAFFVKKESKVKSKLEVQEKHVVAHISFQVENHVGLELQEALPAG